MMVRPDGFIGAVMAIEGISDAHVLLHGPDGCRKNLAVLSGHCYPRDRNVDASGPYFRGSPRVPCTGVESSDYIFGSYRKVVDALEALKRTDAGLVAVMPTPGASLIGDDCGRAIDETGMTYRAFALDATSERGPMAHGFDRAISEAVRKLAVPKERRKGTVVLLGVSVLMKDWTTVVEEFSDLLALMGLEVVCVPGAGSSTEDIRSSLDAEFAVVLCPEYASATAELYRDTYSVRVVSPGYSPVGFDATLAWIDSIASATGADPSKAKEKIHESMKRAYWCMEAARTRTVGITFRLDADASVAYPLTRWLMESFSMVPTAVTMPPGGCEASMGSLTSFLSQKGLEDIIGRDDESFTEIVLCDGNTARTLQAAKRCRKGIDIGHPSVSNVDFRRSPIFGASGALYLLDRMMNP